MILNNKELGADMDEDPYMPIKTSKPSVSKSYKQPPVSCEGSYLGGDTALNQIM